MSRKRRGNREEVWEGGSRENPDYEDFEVSRVKEARSRREAQTQKASHPAKIIAFAGGKGGMGVSLFAANAAIYLAQMGNHTVLADTDLGAGNLHTILGLTPPEETLADFISRRVERLDSLRVETRVPYLELIPSACDPVGAASIKHAQRGRLLSHLAQVEADYLLLDVGSGLGHNCLDLFLAARFGVLLLVPEPTAIESTYRFLRAAFFRKISQQKWPAPVEKKISQMQDEVIDFPGAMPKDLVEEVLEIDPESAHRIAQELWRFRPAILINQARTRSDSDIGEAVRSACWRRMGIYIELLGHIDFDDAAWISVRRRRPLLHEDVDAMVSRQIEQVVHRMLAALTRLEQLPPLPEPLALLPPLEEQTYYEILEIEPGASEDELRRAHKKMRALYSDESLGLYGLYQAEEIEKMQRKLAEAYDCLMDLERRRLYDTSLFPEGHPGRAWIEDAYGRLRQLAHRPPSSEGAPEDPDAANISLQVELPPDSELTGDWLRSVREARGVALVDIAARTKISLVNLQWIEEEDFEKMIAPVYVRGFVLEYARYLKLDAERVARVYVDRYRNWLDMQAARFR